MTRAELCAARYGVLEKYSKIGKVISSEPYGNGHINDTFLTVAEGGRRYILQRINNVVFPKPWEVMENITSVTEHIRAKATSDVERSTLTVVPTDEGESFYLDENGSYWRLYDFVEGTVSRERVESIAEFESCAEAFGEFQRSLADFPAESLHEAIVNFHNTEVRYENLMKAIERDAVGRASDVAEEIAFVRARYEFACSFERAREQGILPLRVTHNDTKLNNILFDAESLRPVCVIDLDTVMPGYSMNDFGDSIRFGANTAAEDEVDLSRVSLDMELYRAYEGGFIRGCGGALTDFELENLSSGAMMMTFECGMRFLTDYLDGDVYFKISPDRPRHNLDRARCQFALLADMERKLGK